MEEFASACASSTVPILVEHASGHETGSAAQQRFFMNEDASHSMTVTAPQGEGYFCTQDVVRSKGKSSVHSYASENPELTRKSRTGSSPSSPERLYGRPTGCANSVHRMDCGSDYAQRPWTSASSKSGASTRLHSSGSEAGYPSERRLGSLSSLRRANVGEELSAAGRRICRKEFREGNAVDHAVAVEKNLRTELQQVIFGVVLFVFSVECREHFIGGPKDRCYLFRVLAVQVATTILSIMSRRESYIDAGFSRYKRNARTSTISLSFCLCYARKNTNARISTNKIVFSRKFAIFSRGNHGLQSGGPLGRCEPPDELLVGYAYHSAV